LKLPSRYYHFNDNENYIKLLTIGEGIFPNDKIQTTINLINSTCILTTESATKVYPSTSHANNAFAINRLNFSLSNCSNFEYINDELILYNKAKFAQLVNFNISTDSTFFYVDVMSTGRSFEHFDFDLLKMRNRFVINNQLEYFENYSVTGYELKQYFKRHQSHEYYYGKVYIKSSDNKQLRATLRELGFTAFTQTRKQNMLIGVLTNTNIDKLKKQMLATWQAYRCQLNKKPFDLGKA